MRYNLEGTKGYDQIEAEQDSNALLKFIKNIMVGVEESLNQTYFIKCFSYVNIRMGLNSVTNVF